MKFIRIAAFAICLFLFSGAIALSEGFFMRSGEIMYADKCPEGYQAVSGRLILGEGETRVITNEAKYFASNNHKIVSIDEHGVMQAISTGKTLISVYFEDNLRKDFEVEVRVAPRSIKLSHKKATLKIGDTHQLTSTITTSSACTITWFSSAPNLVSVNNTGLLTALGEGTCTITARTHNGLTAECAVTVKLPPPAEIDLFSDTVQVYMGESSTILYKLVGGYNETVKWSISDESIATIDQNGVVTAVSLGKTVALLEASGGDVRFIDIIVKEGATSLDFPAEEVTLYIGGRTILEPAITGGSGKYTYTSMDTSIASIDPETQEICALREGSVYILGITPIFAFDEFLLTIIPGPTELTLVPERNEIAIGDTILTENNLSDYEPLFVWYESSDPEIVHVDEYGVITGLKKGTAVISIHCGGLTAQTEITVLPPAGKLDAWAERTTLGAGESTKCFYSLGNGTGIVTYASSDLYVAQIDAETGTIYALSPGTCEITLSVSEKVSDSFTIEVFPAPESVYIEKNSYTISAGNRCAFVFGTEEGALTSFHIASSHPELVWYQDGYLYCSEQTGSATVTVSSHTGQTAQAEVTVIPAPDQIQISANKLTNHPDFDYYITLTIEETRALNAAVAFAQDLEFLYSASHPDIASISKTGVITAHKEGSCLITVSLFSGVEARILVSVED